jgi:hypothetical protein
MGVLALWRYPVKAMLGQRLDAVEIGPWGCRGDRNWIVVDSDTGARIGNKRGPTDPRLRACRSELIGEDLRITLPGGEAVQGPAIEPALSDLLHRRVRLERGPHHDLAPIHLIAASTVRRFGGDARRFRANLVLDDGAAVDGFAEDALVGGTLRGPSGLELAVELHTPRCVVPTRAIEELPHDPGLLRAIVREHRIDLGWFGRHGCAGAYATVAQPGALRVGDVLV